jgi:hypothetical protein
MTYLREALHSGACVIRRPCSSAGQDPTGARTDRVEGAHMAQQPAPQEPSMEEILCLKQLDYFAFPPLCPDLWPLPRTR